MGRTQGIFNLINKERKSVGLKPVEWNQGLFRGCKQHTKDMLNSVGLNHATSGIPDGGECIWGGRGRRFSARAVVRRWMNSPGHR